MIRNKSGINQQESDFFLINQKLGGNAFSCWFGLFTVLSWLQSLSRFLPSVLYVLTSLSCLSPSACKIASYPHKIGPRVRREGLRLELSSMFAPSGENLYLKPPAGFPLYLFGQNWATRQTPGWSLAKGQRLVCLV